MVSHEAVLRLLKEANKEAKIPPKPDVKDWEAWCEYFTARVKIGQAKRLIVAQYFQ